MRSEGQRKNMGKCSIKAWKDKKTHKEYEMRKPKNARRYKLTHCTNYNFTYISQFTNHKMNSSSLPQAYKFHMIAPIEKLILFPFPPPPDPIHQGLLLLLTPEMSLQTFSSCSYQRSPLQPNSPASVAEIFP